MPLMAPLDWLSFILALVATVGFVLWGKVRQSKTRKTNAYLTYILMGRGLTLPFFTASLVASWYGGIFGVTSMAYESGLFSFATQGLFWYFSYFIFALCVLPRIQQINHATLASFIGDRYGGASRRFCALLNFATLLPVAPLLSLGFFLSLFVPAETNWSILTALGFVLVYSWRGGLASVVYSDLWQFFLMFFGVSLVVFYSFPLGGISYLARELPEAHLTLDLSGQGLDFLAWFAVAFTPLISPQFYHRCFAAQDQKTARRGILLSICFWFLFDCITHLGAFYAKAARPELEPPTAYFYWAAEVLPPGLLGLFLAGVLATILSTLDSYLFLAATTLQYDIGNKSETRSHPLYVISAALIAFGLCLVLENDIPTIWMLFGSLSISALFWPLMGPILFRQRGALPERLFLLPALFGIISVFMNRWILSDNVAFALPDLIVGLAVSGCVFLMISVHMLKRGNL